MACAIIDNTMTLFNKRTSAIPTRGASSCLPSSARQRSVRIQRRAMHASNMYAAPRCDCAWVSTGYSEAIYRDTTFDLTLLTRVNKQTVYRKDRYPNC